MPFKVCYALAWPTLGGGTMLAVMPEASEVERRLDSAELERRRSANAALAARLRAGGSEQQQQQQQEDGSRRGRG